MTHLSNFSLQQSVYQILSGDSTLNTLIAGVFDHVPQGSEYPFATIGECVVFDASNAEKPGTENRLSIHVYSRAAGRKEASVIMERIVTLLSNASFVVTGQSLIYSHFIGSKITLLDDGATYRGTLNLSVGLTEA